MTASGRSLSFRAKILFALVGTVVILVGASLLTIQSQRKAQVLGQVERASEQARRAFAEVEGLRNEELERLGQRFTRSIRLPAAMEAALEYGDPSILAEAAEYELALAGLSYGIAVFADSEGQEVVSLVNGATVPREGTASVDPLVARLLRLDEARVTGYRIREGVLFSVHVYRLDLFGELLGAFTLGFPLDDAVAARLGEVAGAEICFLVDDLCLAGTSAFEEGAFVRKALQRGGDAAARPLLHDRSRWASTFGALPGGEDAGVQQLLAIPLEQVLLPFDRIQRVERAVGGAALMLALLVGTMLARGLSNPLRALVEATDRVRRGEYDFTLPVERRDELGDLADAFNGMLTGLALKEKYRGVLDKVVSKDIAEEMLKGEIRLGGEVRDVTTLFADIRGFTTLSEGLESREIIAMLNEWFDIAAAAVEGESGVVDKYSGDGLMAIFGAPISEPEHALRGVRAALRMKRELEGLNWRRDERGEPPLEVGIGICTGSVVAGNTGSQNRLNYTVLGESVNLASRLCSEAGASEILMGEATRQSTLDTIEAVEQPSRRLKGLSEEVRPWLVTGLRPDAGGARTGAGLTRVGTLVALLSTALLLAPSPGVAQRWIPDPPSLADLGVGYSSPSGFFQIYPSGRLELEGYRPGDAPPWLIQETENFVAGRLRLFADAFVGERVYGTLEVRGDRGEEPTTGPLEARLQQAFIRVGLTQRLNLQLQAGKFVTPFGNHPSRRRTAGDPFIRPPLHYDHRTIVSSAWAPTGADMFLDAKNDPDSLRALGAPVVWGTPYPVGVMLLGSAGKTTFRIATVNSAPSSEPDQWSSPAAGQGALRSIIAHVGHQLLPELGLGVSYNAGPYLRPDVLGQRTDSEGLPEMRAISKYHNQTMWGAEATFMRGPLELRGEIIHDSWGLEEVTKDAVDLSWFLEGKMKTGGGAYGALRYGAIHFNDLERTTGEREPWDYDVRRLQVAAGYRLARNIEARGEYLVNTTSSPLETAGNLLSVQLGWSF